MSKRKTNVLYITYDGLLDPLGSSQILPYILRIAPEQHRFHVLSFEKAHSFLSRSSSVRSQLSAAQISWTPLYFTNAFGLFGKVYDLLCMYIAAFAISLSLRPSIVHARGHSPAQVGYFIKFLFSSKLIFDFRGLWVDERVDKGGWNLAKPIDRLQYYCFKYLEKLLLRNADHTVVLTEAVVNEVLKLGVPTVLAVSVIPCCADFKHFKLATKITRQRARSTLQLHQEQLVIGYLGSIGPMYLISNFLEFLSLLSDQDIPFQALVITPDVQKFTHLVQQNLPPSIHPFIVLTSADRNQVPLWLPAIDVLVSFISPSYARIGASPTRLAESWACGIPTICNYGVGDVAKLNQDLDAGLVVDCSSRVDLINAAHAISYVISKGGPRLREAARAILSLDVAAERYLHIYQSLQR